MLLVFIKPGFWFNTLHVSFLSICLNSDCRSTDCTVQFNFWFTIQTFT